MSDQINIVETLKVRLQEGEVHFQFVKKDGSIRDAVGTLNIDMIPEKDRQFATPEEERKERTGIVTYYDLEKGAWRCCKMENIMTIN